MNRLKFLTGAKFVALIDWIWIVRGSLPLTPGQSGDAVFAALAPLLGEPGTTRRIDGDTLTFHKVDPLAQDKLAVFDHGHMHITAGELRYELTSRALGFCFLAPFFVLGIAALIEDSRISGRVFAGMFAVLYVAGRLLEARLVAKRFARLLAGSDETRPADLPGLAQAGSG